MPASSRPSKRVRGPRSTGDPARVRTRGGRRRPPRRAGPRGGAATPGGGRPGPARGRPATVDSAMMRSRVTPRLVSGSPARSRIRASTTRTSSATSRRPAAASAAAPPRRRRRAPPRRGRGRRAPARGPRAAGPAPAGGPRPTGVEQGQALLRRGQRVEGALGEPCRGGERGQELGAPARVALAGTAGEPVLEELERLEGLSHGGGRGRGAQRRRRVVVGVVVGHERQGQLEVPPGLLRAAHRRAASPAWTLALRASVALPGRRTRGGPGRPRCRARGSAVSAAAYRSWARTRSPGRRSS